MAELTHIDEKGRARMVDVTAKDVTERVAAAAASVTMRAETLALIQAGDIKKGDVLAVARLAGIMAAKRTAELVPLCHPLALTAIDVSVSPNPERKTVDIEATVKLRGRTGAEMEAMTAVAVAALSVYDMCKAVDRTMRITDVRLTYKTGGKSGTFVERERRR
ncbi:MAG: cyclic pyranopterin monophosphate synthase MoaC [Alphaproteobacteria bacterium]